VADIKNYIWVIPLIAGILLLISWFTPSAYVSEMGIEEYYWMWGLAHASMAGYGSNTLFFPSEEPSKYMIPIFLSGIFSAIIILISSIILIISANIIRVGRKNAKNFENLWIGIGITLFIMTIIYVIAVDITIVNYIENYVIPELIDEGAIPPGEYDVGSFWDTYDPGFAVIAPFLSFVLIIASVIASKYVSKREREIPIIEKSIPGTEPVITEENKTLRYCPECGQKVMYEGSKFCPNCGYELHT
jgi:hypothetical protein